MAYGGAIIGPCCGRIPNGFVDMDDCQISLSMNEKKHHLHGGYFSTALRSWELMERSGTSVLFRIAVKDGVDGYPGNRLFQTRYSLDDMAVFVEIQGESDRLTIVNPTNHAYWNLNDESVSSVLNHRFRISSSLYYPTNGEMLPQKPQPVYGTSFDFNSPRSLKKALEIDCPSDQLKIAKGFNHGWRSSSLYCEGNRGGLRVTSDADDIWLYSGGFLDRTMILEDGSCAKPSCAFAVEPQNIGRPTLLHPGEIFIRSIEFKLQN